MGTVDIIISLVVGIHVSEDILTDSLIDIQKTQPIARCRYYQYARIRETFEMVIPRDGKVLYGLQESAAPNAKERARDPEIRQTGLIKHAQAVDISLLLISVALISQVQFLPSIISNYISRLRAKTVAISGIV